jgi:hypothetical protein
MANWGEEVSAAEARSPDDTTQLQGLNETGIKTFWRNWVKSSRYQGLTCSCATTVGKALSAFSAGTASSKLQFQLLKNV